MIAHMNDFRVSKFAYIETSGFDHYYPSPQVKLCVYLHPIGYLCCQTSPHAYYHYGILHILLGLCLTCSNLIFI